MELPRVSHSQIFFPEGVVDINACTLGLLTRFFGEYVIVHGARSSQAHFVGQLGVIKGVFLQDQQVQPSSDVLGLDLVLDRETSLAEMMAGYQLEPKILVLAGPNFFAVFSPNFSAKLSMPSRTIQTLTWQSLDHVSSCPCEFCKGVRKIHPEIQGGIKPSSRMFDA